MLPKTLDDQLYLVRRDSWIEFVRYIDEFTLKSKAIAELYKPRIHRAAEKFESYIRKYGRLKLEDERRLLETHRRDLQEIYFRLCSCHEKNEPLIVQNSDLSKLYYKYGHCPGVTAQKHLIKRKVEDIYRFIKNFEFCEEVFALFWKMADKKLKACYLSAHPAAVAF